MSISRMMLALVAVLLPLAVSAQEAAVPASMPAQASARHAPPADAELFNALGGLPVIQQVVNDFVDNMLADRRIAHTFAGANIARIKEKLTEEFCMLSGGGCVYTGDPIKDVHQGLNLTNAHFNALVEDLQAAMDKAGIAFRTQNRLLHILAPLQRDTVSR